MIPTKEEMKAEIGAPFLRPLAVLQLLALLAMFSTPIVTMWKDWATGWRVGLTGLLIFLLFRFIYFIVNTIIDEFIDKEHKKWEDDEARRSKEKGFFDKIQDQINEQKEKEQKDEN